MNKTSQLPLKLQGMIKLVSLILLLVFLQKKTIAQKNDTVQIPALCYHNIHQDLAGHSPAYSIGIAQFKRHLKMLHDSGYNSILPSQLYAFLTTGASLPPKPIIISFDDSHEEHFSIAMPVLNSFHFKGVFFVMAVTINKPMYMKAGQIKELADSGHCIGLHTWDHPDLRKLKGNDWLLQIKKPKALLEKITGKPVEYFAYPNGAWNEEAIHQLKDNGILAAFQLSGKRSPTLPLYTIRRLLVSGLWSEATLQAAIRSTFH